MILHNDPPEQPHPSNAPASREALRILAETQDIDHLEICFPDDKHADFYPRTNNPERLYQRLKWFVKMLRQRPELLRHAAGACEGGNEHGQ